MKMLITRTSILTVGLFFMSLAVAQKAYFAGGCFWCMESDFEKLEGVSEVISGFTGGKVDNPTYHGNHDGHYEAVEIHYDPEIVTYKQLLQHFWLNIDPFDAEGQFCDKGHSYLSAIFVDTPAQQALALMSKEAVQRKFPKQQIVTPILPLSTFYPIKGDEEYHQDFYKKNPVRYKFYRWNCGRDQRLQQLWGEKSS